MLFEVILQKIAIFSDVLGSRQKIKFKRLERPNQRHPAGWEHRRRRNLNIECGEMHNDKAEQNCEYWGRVETHSEH
jgi:hypothetical protein